MLDWGCDVWYWVGKLDCKFPTVTPQYIHINRRLFIQEAFEKCWTYCTEPHQSYTWCSHIQCASKLPIAVPIFQSMSEWQCNTINFFPQKRQFSDFHWLPWQRPLSNCQMNANFIKPLH